MPSLFRQLRFWSRLALAFLGKYYAATFIGTLFGITAFILSPRLLPLLPKIRSQSSIALVGRFSPTNIPISLQQKISLGLTTLTPDGLPAPGLAKAWTIDDSGKNYTFEINTAYKWQNGKSITSRDINYRFKDTDVDYPDDTHLVIKLKEPFSPLPVVVSRPAFKSGLLGAGAYKVESLKKAGSIVESISLSPTDRNSRLPILKYYFYPSEHQARLAFKLGTVNSIEDIQDLADLSQWPGINTQAIVQTDRYLGIFFNTQDPMFSGQSGKSLRQALAYAINKSLWPNQAYGPVSPLSWAFNPEVKKYDYDLARAKQLLAGVEKKPQQLDLSTLPVYLPIAESIKTDWEMLGVTTNIRIIPELTADFTVLLVAQQIPTDPDQYNLWHSTQTGTNLTKFNRPRADKLLEDGRKTTDLKTRKEIYTEFQKYLTEEVPVIFLFHPTTYTVSRP